MADIKQFPPSEEKLAQLRREGVVAFSRDALSGACMLGLLLGIMILVQKRVDGVLQFFTSSFSGSNVLSPGQQLNHAWMTAGGLVASVLVAVLVAVILIGALQTKFLWTMQPLAIDASRLFALSRFSASSLWRNALSTFFALGKALGALSLLLCLFYFELKTFSAEFWLEASALWQQGAEIEEIKGLVLRYPQDTIGRAALFLLGYAVVVGILSYISSLWAFRHQHAMSRAEVEEENRRTEGSQEVRDARVSQDDPS